MTLNKLPDSRLYPCYVHQMIAGDVYGVEPWAIRGDCKNGAFIVASAPVSPVGEGLVTVERQCDGWCIDLSNVPGERFARHIRGKVYRVTCVKGAC